MCLSVLLYLLYLGGEVGRGAKVVLDEGALDHVLLAAHGLHQAAGEVLAGEGLSR